MEDGIDLNPKKIFDRRLFTQYSREKLYELERRVVESTPRLNELMRTDQWGVFVFGSGAVGLATDEITTTGEPFPYDAIGYSDIDTFVVFMGNRPAKLVSLPLLLATVTSDRAYAVGSELVRNHQTISNYGTVTKEEFLAGLDNIAAQSPSERNGNRNSRFYLYLVLNSLLSHSFGNSNFINELKVDLIDKLTGLETSGEEMWNLMNDLLRENYLHYGENAAGDNPKKAKRYNEAMQQILNEHSVASDRNQRTLHILERRKTRINLPNLDRAKEILIK